MLAADIAIASEDARFAQLEVKRGIVPNCGATIRMPSRLGWGNAMRWLLTGDVFDAAEALRIGVVQEVVGAGLQMQRAVEIAEQIAECAAPLAVRAVLSVAHRAVRDGEQAAVHEQKRRIPGVLASNDAQEGIRSFVERRAPYFEGR